MINNILFLAYEIWFYLVLITSVKILLLSLYIFWVLPYTTKKIKICGGPRDSGKIRSSSWSAKDCPGLVYANRTPERNFSNAYRTQQKFVPHLRYVIKRPSLVPASCRCMHSCLRRIFQASVVICVTSKSSFSQSVSHFRDAETLYPWILSSITSQNIFNHIDGLEHSYD
jgi:hypothetical protein